MWNGAKQMMKATVIATENTHRRMGEGRETRDGKKLGGKEIRRERGGGGVLCQSLGVERMVRTIITATENIHRHRFKN